MLRPLPFALALLALGASASVAAAQGDPEKGKIVFKKCKICHKVGEGAKKGVGPHLNNVIGAAAGSREGYNYSKAMKEAGKNGLVWTPETLDRYIRKPKEVVPGTKMPFPGLKDDAQRQDLIAYLQQFSKQPDK